MHVKKSIYGFSFSCLKKETHVFLLLFALLFFLCRVLCRFWLVVAALELEHSRRHLYMNARAINAISLNCEQMKCKALNTGVRGGGGRGQGLGLHLPRLL